MKIDLCKVFGVEEGEEFKLVYGDLCDDLVRKIENNKLYYKDYEDNFRKDIMGINEIEEITKINKLPKKKQFTDDELCILRNVDKEYKWIVRDNDNCLSISEGKPYKINRDDWYHVSLKPFMFEHLFNSIQWEDEEPVFIDDYVER